ncbi:hypothetical protein MBH78_22340 [Oceanimonas sp. NS1]|nr:hypothetical protein [Oceanimonas sp. NS1]
MAGHSGEQQLWLFGSIHIADERLATLPPSLLQALEESELLLLRWIRSRSTPQILPTCCNPAATGRPGWGRT